MIALPCTVYVPGIALEDSLLVGYVRRYYMDATYYHVGSKFCTSQPCAFTVKMCLLRLIRKEFIIKDNYINN